MFDFNLDDVLAEPTVMRSEVAEQESVAPLEDFSGLQFEELPEVQEEAEQLPVEPPYTEKEAKENAEMLVDFLDTFNTMALTPLARWKLRKKRLGEKSNVWKMQALLEKEYADEKLNEKEKRALIVYKSYLADKKELENAIPFTDAEKEKLKHSASIWLKNKRIRIGGEFGFWGEYAMIQGTRVMEILTA